LPFWLGFREGGKVAQVLLIYAHPRPRSFNAAIASTVITALEDAGIEVQVHDLYRDGFYPVLAFEPEPDELTERYRDELLAARGYVIVHPNWYGQPPAILKGYIDKVFREDVTFRFAADDDGSGVPEGLLTGEAALVLNTSDTHPERESAVFGDPLDGIWRDCVFGFSGVPAVHRCSFQPVAGSSDRQRRQWLEEAGGLATALFSPGTHP
jgi:putative NADPH-quinone reductase